MISTLSNEKISIAVNSIGAELWSIKKVNDAFEYLWQGDEAYWTGRSPVLFPNVGAVKNSVTRVDGVTYPLGNHGFPKKEEFKLLESSEDTLVYEYRYNGESLKMYPYRFALQLAYTLVDTTVAIGYTVRNLDNKTIYFQLGTHPGFNCPMNDDLAFSDYYLEFNESEKSRRLFFDAANLLISNKETEGLDGNTFELSHDLFVEGACIFRDIKSTSITLKSDKDSRAVTLSFNKFPYLGVWQKHGAPYVCIEPWHGISDLDTYTGEFKDKEMIIALEKKEEYLCRLDITIS